ncbi:2-polyprenyl-6-methoxyphenol hydroxylase-like oxidoreductase [Rivularia sp. PCC 7116]|uniref:FAD-dependent monooxygenase n=1 Tax=Rivularia sp. PCC 7116 TaxID=373994 RepID=UPI00029F0354|nr:FAD-dependent monooxygenase [Rivularia sp. PCC 7116]AFY53692.1 2-polyprenyl-6-methoxyphenol hydroxylase-like oxidoreductase [Rivularia sp. PCC 7116]
MKKVAIAGGGPTGVTLALMLVQRGIAVTLVEAASDFRRVFRGEALMPSGLNALDEMGLSKILEEIPHRELNAWEFILNKKPLFKVDEPIETDTQPCTLFSQPPLLETLILEARKYSHFEFIQGVAVKDLLRIDNRVAGIRLADGREITADIVIGADGRNSIIRQSAGIKIQRQPKSMDILWFKLAANPLFVTENIFTAIGDGENAFAVFHGASPGKLHLGWTISEHHKNINISKLTKADWAKMFASISPSWLAEHFIDCADSIEKPIKLSVVVGLCPRWYAPGVLLLGDAAHPMSPIRAQGINIALRDVIVAVNHLVPVLTKETENKQIDEVFSQIQKEREPEIIRIQQLQKEEARQHEILPKNLFLRKIVFRLARLGNKVVRLSWIQRQKKMRQGVTQVKLEV